MARRTPRWACDAHARYCPRAALPPITTTVDGQVPTPRHGRHGRIATRGRLTVALRLDRSGDRRAWRRIDAHEAHHGGPLGRPRPCRRCLQRRQHRRQPRGTGVANPPHRVPRQSPARRDRPRAFGGRRRHQRDAPRRREVRLQAGPLRADWRGRGRRDRGRPATTSSPTSTRTSTMDFTETDFDRADLPDLRRLRQPAGRGAHGPRSVGHLRCRRCARAARFDCISKFGIDMSPVPRARGGWRDDRRIRCTASRSSTTAGS